jgi:hypothetical protein
MPAMYLEFSENRHVLQHVVMVQNIGNSATEVETTIPTIVQTFRMAFITAIF